MKTRYSAVVESGSYSDDYERWEESINCGHLHKSPQAALRCGKKNYGAHINKITHSWEACAAWHGYRVHDQNNRRVAADVNGVL